jgi:hypothetical protein
MKTTFRIVVMVLFAAFYSCKKNDVSPGVSSSISNNGILTGTIVNDSNRIDSIKVYDYIVDNYNVVEGSIIIGKSAVLSSGKFSLVLTNPVLRKIGTGPSGVIVSDTTAMVGNMNELEAYKSGIYYGNINKSNFSISDIPIAGESTSQFMYSDRTFTIKGTEIDADTTYTYKSNLKINYSITFKKGWNEIVLEIDSYSNTTTTTTTVETYSNNITSDLQWRYYPNNNASSVRAKTQGVHSIARPTFLF